MSVMLYTLLMSLGTVSLYSVVSERVEQLFWCVLTAHASVDQN